MELTTAKKLVRVVIDRKEHFLTMPKMRHQILWDKILDGDRKKGYAQDLLDLLFELGLPKEVGLELEEGEIVEILQGIGEAKKKLKTAVSSSPDSSPVTAAPPKNG